jgi:hypothetical protein
VATPTKIRLPPRRLEDDDVERAAYARAYSRYADSDVYDLGNEQTNL